MIESISPQDNFKIYSPEFVPENTAFEVSIITSNKFPDFKSLNIYFLPDPSLIINNVELWIDSKRKELPISSEFVPEYSELFKKVIVDLLDTSIFKGETFFQIVLFVKPGSAKSNSLQLFGSYIHKDQTIRQLTTSDLDEYSENPGLYNLLFKYYERTSIPGNAALLEYNSYLNIAQVYAFKDVLNLEFWMKTKNFNSEFFRIINGETNWVEYSLSINENQMLYIDSKNDKLLSPGPYFISENIWYHFLIRLDKQNNEIKFFINGSEVAHSQISNSLNPDNLFFHLQNSGHDGELIVDQFRLILSSSSLSEIMKNRNYSDYLDDSSNVIFQMNFSQEELDAFREQKKISYEMIRLKNSDAPLFSRGPELKVKLMNNYYEVEWSGGSTMDADFYVLEKAVGNGKYTQVEKSRALNEDGKIYSLLSENKDQNEIVYFRIKQINKDGSSVYSDDVKVGQGLVEDLIVDQNYPNPFNPTTTIEFDLLQDSDVEVKIFDLSGVEVAVLHKGFLSSGSYKYKFDATGLTSGIYLYQVKTPTSSLTRKMILTK